MRILPEDEIGKQAGVRPGYHWKLAVGLALTAMFSGLLLTGVSVWFLGAVALAGAGPAAFAFNFHVPAALVRLFALTRTAAKYGERVVGHKAALLDQVSRRTSLFQAMAAAPLVRSASWQFGDQDRLSDFMDDVEDVDYAKLRVGLPVLSIGVGVAGLCLATLFIVPLALIPISVLLLVNALLVLWLFPRATEARRSVRSMRRTAARRLGETFAAAVPLQAERSWVAMVDTAFGRLAAAEATALHSRREQAMLDCVIGISGPLAGLAVLILGWMGGYRGEALLPATLLAFTWLALGETMQGFSRILVARTREDAAKKNIRNWTADRLLATPAGDISLGELDELRLARIPIISPAGRRIGGPVDLIFRRGRPAAIVGPSGCGKTSLLKQMAGWFDIDPGGAMLVDGMAIASPERRRLVHLGLHDAAILSDTVRENLFAPDATDAECWSAIDAVELKARVRSAGGLDGWITQDMLSLGEAQRLNLARAMLSPSPIVLLDEPTEHLDRDQARRIMSRVIAHFRDRILLFSSHESAADWAARRVRVIRLDVSAKPSPECAVQSSFPRQSQ